MADIYPGPTGNDTIGILEFLEYVNKAADGLFFPIILFGIWVITFTAMLASGGFNRPSGAKAFVFSNFICMILGIILAVLGVLPRGYMYILILLTGTGVLWLILENSKD